MTMADNRQNGSILQNFFPTFNYQKDHGDFILYFHHLYHWLTLFWLIILSATNLTKFLFNYCNSSIKNLSNLGSGFGAVSWQKGRGFNLVIDIFIEYLISVSSWSRKSFVPFSLFHQFTKSHFVWLSPRTNVWGHVVG